MTTTAPSSLHRDHTAGLSADRRSLLDVFNVPTRRAKVVAAGLSAAGLVAAASVVYATGGVKLSYVHLVYVPIIFAALIFGVSGGVVAGAVGALLVGPRMPIDTVTGEHQHLLNWLQRGFFFCLIGGLVGAGAASLRRQARELRWLNDHDPRTGLLSRAGFMRTLSDRLADPQSAADPLNVVVVSLHNLLDIQMTFGSEFGDKLVAAICERGRALIPAEFPVALLQPDRMAYLLPSSAAKALKHELESRFREPFDVDGVLAYVDSIVGVAVVPDHGTTAEELLQKAKIAMHTAVQHNVQALIYDTAIDRTSRDNLVLLGLVPAALANNELAIWHQAKLSFATGDVVATEALLRWNHPQRGLIPPGMFIPQVEESPLINDITRWVIEEAFRHKEAWAARDHRIGVSINLSVRNLHDGALLAVLDEAVGRHGVAPERIELEVTESAVMDDFEFCASLIGQLRDRGHAVSIDDFGTGQSSLAYLKRLPVTTLKVDQSFIRNLATDTADQIIARTIIDLARAMNLTSVAEGVEDEESARLLRDWGCDYAQGYHFHKPCPYDDFITWYEQRAAALPTA